MRLRRTGEVECLGDPVQSEHGPQHRVELEIIQTAPGTIWVPADSGVHHLGLLVRRRRIDLATMEYSGMPCDQAKSYNPDGSGTLLWA